MNAKKHTNSLINELSAYLLQHAHNPVDWFPWKKEHLKKAKEEGKLILISIGYASCHWCHVMEHECFEDEEVASFMNSNFINIKVDREERPDVDQVYMNALQLISGQGGWPLNMIALPDGRPIWGGTYFPKERWLQVLSQIKDLSQKKPQDLIQYADNLEKGLAHFEPQQNTEELLSFEELSKSLEQVISKKDSLNGGLIGAPKFMMPTLLQFIYNGSKLCSNEDGGNHFHFSLEKMALGGIFDCVEGGFSRYAVDEEWHVPHFEKMGYDNGQLISLYSKAFKDKPKELYKEVVYKTISFVKDNLCSPQGGFYAALDADSIDEKGKLVEGAYYVWTKEKILTLFPENHRLVSTYFSINDDGYWEDGNFVLRRMQNDEEFANRFQIPLDELKTKVLKWNTLLLEERNKRPKPRLDDKIICSWNALLTSGILDAYRSFRNPEHLELALNNLKFIENNFINERGNLKRISKNGINKIDGFLEDYATIIKLYVDLYETIFSDEYILKAQKLMEYCISNFKDENGSLFFFSETDELVIRTKEISDNVIPSSNAIMAENLIRLSSHLGTIDYKNQAIEMIRACKQDITEYPRNYTYWLTVAFRIYKPGYEVVAVGPNAKKDIEKLQNNAVINCSWSAANNSSLPLFKNRSSDSKTVFYLCRESQCELPLNSIEAVQKKLKELIS